jgi:hypothetical protein
LDFGFELLPKVFPSYGATVVRLAVVLAPAVIEVSGQVLERYLIGVITHTKL